MEEFPKHFEFAVTSGQLLQIYIFLVFGGIIALYMTITSTSAYKKEMFFISFFLITGNLNKLLTVKIPGFSFFEIQPIRFIYLMLLVLIIRKLWASKQKLNWSAGIRMPWFMVALICYITLLSISVVVNVFPEELKVILDAVAFLIIVIGLRMMADKPSYDLIGKSFIFGAVISSLVAFVQLLVNPYFLRIGDVRAAFGSFIRANGLFDAEYHNSYFLIIAITWTFVTVKNNVKKVSLISLFSLGVITSFMRMSWIILALVIFIYLVYIIKLATEKVALIGLSGFAMILLISVFFYSDIMNSSLVKERLEDTVDSRGGYYTMVIENFGKKPLFGYGNLKNEVYYENLLRITGSRERASAKTGSLHSGYFSALFLYGVPAFISFLLFVFLSLGYYARSLRMNKYFVVPFLVSILFIVGNLTNTFLFISYLSVLYAIHIGIGMGIYEKNGQENIQDF